MAAMTDDMICVPPEDAMGEAMLALEPKQRRFVCALAICGGDQSRAYRWAGYKTTNDKSTSAAASRLAANDTVIAAIREETLRCINSSTLYASNRLFQIAAGQDDKLAMTASLALLNRAGFHEKTEHRITVKKEHSTDELITLFRQLAQKNALEIIDVEAEEVPQLEYVDPDLADLI